MDLRLVGHDYKYAVEQIMLSLFPEEKPHYSYDPILCSHELFAESRLHFSGLFAQSVTIMRCNDKVSRGYARVSRSRLTDRLSSDRLLQRIIKQSFFRAASAFIQSPPVWGSLTGIRPAHVAAAIIASGKTEKAAERTLIRDYYVSPERAELCISAARVSMMVKQRLEQRDIALYVGIPFCPTRCAYCSFVSNSVEKSFSLIDPFVKTLISELEMASGLVKELGLRVIAIYVGGGTPTALPAEALKTIMQSLKLLFDMSQTREYTVEAGRPDTITRQNLEIISRFGAERVCVNPQSMSREVLTAIGRNHTPEDVLKAARLVNERGLALNMDIIAGLPRDTPESFQNTLNTVLDLNPANVTVHTLSLKKGSRLTVDGTELPDGNAVGQMLGYASRLLMEQSYEPYYMYRQKFTTGGFENVGWSLPGSEGIYNICMMEELCSVLACGGGGVTKLVSAGGRIERIFNAKYPREYLINADKLGNKFDRIKQIIR